MAYSGGIKISNSFSFQIQNLSGSKQSLSLFELGNSGANAPRSVELYQENNITTLDPYFTKITGNTIETTNATTFQLYISDNGTTRNLSIPMSANYSLLNTNLRLNSILATTTNFEGINMQFVYNVDASSSVIHLDLLITIESTRPNVSIGKLNVSDVPNGSITINFIPISPVKADMTSSFVKIAEVNGVSYDEILRSQTGQVMDIQNMSLDVLTSGDADSQMTNCLRFTKTDVNGNDITYYKCPVKDAYQFQNSYGLIDMNTIADKYTLDGQTQFGYDMEALSTITLGYDYTSLPNLVFGSPYENTEIQEQEQNIDKYRSEGTAKRDIKVDVPYMPPKEKVSDIKKKNTTPSTMPLLILGGLTILGIFLTNKT